MLHERERFLMVGGDQVRTDRNKHLTVGWIGVAAIVLLIMFAIAIWSPSRAEQGLASFYGSESGPRTASGERFDPEAMTAAHRTLPFGTRVRVTNIRTGRSVLVRINDRGPFIKGRIIDLSRGAARVIGITDRAGLGFVRVERVGKDGIGP